MENHGGRKMYKLRQYATNYLYSFCVISVVLSCVIIAIALYLRFDWDIKNYIHGLEAYIIWTGPYILTASSLLTILLGILGCIATMQENEALHLTFAAGSGLTAVLTLSGAAYALNHGTLFSAITPWIEERFIKYIFESDSNPKYARIIRMIQEEVGCCGGSGWQDYTDYNIPLPHECRDPVTGNIHADTCDIALSRFFNPFIGWMAGLALLLLVLQIFAISAALVLRRAFLENQQEAKTLKKISYSAVKARPT